MRSRMNSIVSCSEVHQWALLWLMQAELLKNRARTCTAQVVWSILLRAAARMTSVRVSKPLGPAAEALYSGVDAAAGSNVGRACQRGDQLIGANR